MIKFLEERMFWIVFMEKKAKDFVYCSSRVIISLKVVLNVNACWANSVVGISIFFLITPQPTNWCPIGHGLGPGNMQHHQTPKKLKRFQHSWKIVTCTEKESIFWITVQQLMVLSCGWWGLRSLINDDLKVYTLKSDHRLLHKRN